MTEQKQEEYYVTQKATRSNKYHTDKNCQYLDSHNKVDRDYIDSRELELCKECDDSEYRVNGNHKKYIEKYIE